MKASVEVKFEFPDLLARFEASKDRIEQTIASTIQTQVGLRFDAEGAYNGHDHWAPLKMRQGQILSLTGTLRKSMSPTSPEGQPGPHGFVSAEGSPQNLLIEVGTMLLYASTHNNGAIIRPVNKRALRFFNPRSGKAVFSMKSTIPKRSFTDLNSKDEQELNETLTNLVRAILEGN